MKTPKTLLTILLVATVAAGCNESLYQERHETALQGADAPASIDGIEMVKVPSSLFTFNETPSGRLIEGATHSFEVLQDPFWISREPVPVELYEKYFGKGQYPKNGLSFDQANLLLDKIYLANRIPVVIPTEAMLEAAAHAGAVEILDKYSYLVDDGWGDQAPEKPLVLNWRRPADGNQVVLRGRLERTPVERFRSKAVNRLHIAVKAPEDGWTREMLSLLDPAAGAKPEPSDGKIESFDINGAVFRMMPVRGGKAILGATPEQGDYAEADEAPLREVELEDFKIGETEVTVALWNAVMGYLPVGNNKSTPRQAVVNVSWYDAHEFLLKLSEATGRPFRLPSEDEWEYAARGGRKSKGYIFAGSNNAQEVAICTYKDKKGNPVRPRVADVKSKKPNELGLYDMSGNVWEWVRGTHPDGGCIQKSGSKMSLNTACRVSNRQGMQPGQKKDSFGFRVAL